MRRIPVLHLTDLHYESPEANFRDDNKAYVEPVLRVSYFRNLHRMLKQCFPEKQFAAIALTGDFTTHGRASGFEYFKETLNHLTRLTSAPGAVCMTPGNHDVPWGLETNTPDYFDRKFQAYRNCVAGANATSSFIPTGTIPTNPYGDLKFATDVAGPLYFDHDRRLAVLCINSAMRCGEVNNTIRQALRSPLTKASAEIDAALEEIRDTGKGTTPLEMAKVHLKSTSPVIEKFSLFDIPHVTHTQLDQIVELLRNHISAMENEWPHYVKIALLHHHLAPFDYQLPEYKPFEVMADASSVIDTLAAHGFQTMLTGHKHQRYVQRLQSQGREVLVLGGMTVGGYAVTGFIPSIRHLDFEQTDGVLKIRIADLPCNFDGDIHSRVRELVNEAPEEAVCLGLPRKRSLFPSRIESAAEDQLYGRSFYKTDVIFDVEVTEAEAPNSLYFESRMSYSVVNRTSVDQEWHTDYNFDRDSGSVLKAEFNGEPYDPEQRDFQAGRGISIRRVLAPREEGKAFIHVKERWPDRGSTFYTSYHPATDLKLVLRSQVPGLEFDFEVLYFRNARTIRKEQYWEVHLDRGLLPYQGVRLNWRRKEHANGTPQRT